MLTSGDGGIRPAFTRGRKPYQRGAARIRPRRRREAGKFPDGSPTHTYTPPRPGGPAPARGFRRGDPGGPLWTRGRTEILPALPLGGPRFPLSPAPKICGSQEPRKNGGRGGFLFSSWREGQGPRDGPYSPTPKICGSWRPRKNGEGGFLFSAVRGRGVWSPARGGMVFPHPAGWGRLRENGGVCHRPDCHFSRRPAFGVFGGYGRVWKAKKIPGRGVYRDRRGFGNERESPPGGRAFRNFP